MGWLRGLPECRCEGGMVYVTLHLNPGEASRGPRCVAWSAGGLRACTRKTRSLSLICCIPHGVFQRETAVKLEVLKAREPDEPIPPGTQIPVLWEGSFRACMRNGAPVLVSEEGRKQTCP